MRDTDEWTHPGQQVKVERQDARGTRKKVWVWSCCQLKDYRGANGCTPPPGPRHHPHCLYVAHELKDEMRKELERYEDLPEDEELLSGDPGTPCTWPCCGQEGGDWSGYGGPKLPNGADLPGCTTGLDSKGKKAAIQATAAVQEIFASAKALLDRELDSAEQRWSAIATLIDAAQADAAAMQSVALRWNLVGKRREQADLREFFSELLPQGEAAALFVASKKRKAEGR